MIDVEVDVEGVDQVSCLPKVELMEGMIVDVVQEWSMLMI